MSTGKPTVLGRRVYRWEFSIRMDLVEICDIVEFIRLRIGIIGEPQTSLIHGVRVHQVNGGSPGV